jgi:hypothetical protein
MSLLLVPTLVTQPPEGYPTVAKSHPLAQGMAEFYFLGHAQAWDAYRCSLHAYTNVGVTDSAAYYGRQKTLSSSSNTNSIQIAGAAASPPGSYTVLQACRMTTYAWGTLGFEGLWSLNVANNSASVIAFADDGTSNLRLVNASTAQLLSTNANTMFPADGVTWTIGGVDWNSVGQVAAVYYGGQQHVNSVSLTTAPSGTADHWYIGTEGSSTRVRPGDYAFLVRWNRILTLSEHQSFWQNPWQVLTPLSRRIWVSVAASVTGITAIGSSGGFGGGIGTSAAGSAN